MNKQNYETTACLEELIQELPDLPGVYFFYNKRDELVYIGKSIRIRKRVLQHFQGKDRKSLKIQRTVKRIAYELMGSELVALLYESDLIKLHQPLFNRAQRRTLYQYGLYLQEENGYKILCVDAIREGGNEIASFSSMREAKNALYRITENYELCQKLNRLYKTRYACFQYQIRSCHGACIGREDPESYNRRVDRFLHGHSFERFTQLFEVQGRNEGEKGLVYVEQGVYKGFGFCPKDTPEERFLQHIDHRADNKDVRRILMRYLITRLAVR